MSTAVVTGASSGIGAATARRLAAEGFDVVLAARREQRLRALAGEIGERARVHLTDVTDPASVAALAEAVDECAVLVANAGGALGFEPVSELDEAQWRWMWEANVLGMARTVRALLPRLVESGDGRVVVVTSIAGHQTYPNGAGYTSAKHAAAAVVDTLRIELLGQPVRVTEIAPGLVETEFSTVRFGGDEQRAAGVYEGLRPLTGEDVADAIAYAVTRPPYFTVARMDLFPRAQASARDSVRDRT
ncbi:MAG TPA: SDR family NAD(P)-dependent oxidoreductase [Solirubrobacteraceae bacterium]|nr:SDR family NAD(P)-dependent oxidoreductase [Solirubrobacteraceae bacterium]